MTLLLKVYTWSKKGIWHLARKADISISFMNLQLAFTTTYHLTHATHNLWFLLSVILIPSACPHQVVPNSYCVVIFLMKIQMFIGETWTSRASMLPAAEHEAPGLNSKGPNQRLSAESCPFGRPWGYGHSLNFKRLEETQVKWIFADQSQNPYHLTTLKSFK